MSDLSIKKITPLAGYVLVEPAENVSKTKSGIYIPGNDSEKPQHGTVISVGESIWESGVKEISSPVKAGAKVIFKKWGGNEFKIDDKEYMFIKFEDLLAQVK
ncbi:MAG: co-chaperone GroES [Candidatus Pacebacteria bacterium]|nr:co-chaperone GroES [Candidatus Paceibacterota bacterium]